MNGVWSRAAIEALAILAAVALLAYRYALAHAAVSVASRARLRTMAEQGNPRAEQITALLGRRDAVQGTLRLGFATCLVAGAAAGWSLAAEWRTAGVPEGWVAFGVLLLFGLFAELLPRLAATFQPETVALRQAPWILAHYRLVGGLVRWVLGEPPPARDDSDDDSGEDSIRELVDSAALEPERRRRIADILEFPERTAGEIMVPRIEIVGVSADAPLAEVARRMVESGYSRLPVFGETRDEVIGLARARDVLERLPGEGVARDVAHPPLFVGEAASLGTVLRELREHHSSIAVVIDDYGGVAGLLTVEDVVEEIVGEIHDESDRAMPMIRPRPEGGWLVSGRTDLADLAEVAEVEPVADADYNTVGGLVLALAGDLPEVGEVWLHRAGGRRLALLVTAMAGMRVAEVAVIVLPAADEQDREETPSDEATVTGDTPLAALAESEEAEGVVADLFAFWPSGARAGREVIWHGYRVTATEETAEGSLQVRLSRYPQA